MPITHKSILDKIGFSFITLCVGFLLYSIGNLPYPAKFLYKAYLSTAYSNNWPISSEDYYKALQAVREKCLFPEIAWNVRFNGTDELEIDSLAAWSGHLSSRGRVFHLKKNSTGWIITHISNWVS